MRKLTTKRALVLFVTLALAAVLAGGVVAAQRGTEAPDTDALQGAIRDEPMIKVAEIAASAESPGRGVFVQVTSTGHVCIWDAPSASSQQRQGGCNPADDPLGGSAVSASLAYDGGPAIEEVRDARLIGLASRDAASVAVLMTDGTERQLRLNEASVDSEAYLAFGYRFKKSDLRRGVGPTAVVARDASGAEIARQATGIGS